MASPQHAAYMRLAMAEAQKSPPKPTNFRVGAVLVDESNDAILSTGYTLELPGNTHAEQCCLAKYAASKGVLEEQVGLVLPPETVLYTTMEPCAKRLSGNMPCVERIIRTQGGGSKGIARVYSGVREPETFVGENSGRAQLEKHGVECILITGFEDEIMEIATAGHEKAAA